MRVLRPCPPLAPPDIRPLVAGYEARLRDHPHLATLVPQGDTIHTLFDEAEASLKSLTDAALLSPAAAGAVRGRLERARNACATRPLQLCHGDLSPANLMTDGKGIVAIDWEDVFWGVPGYDYLY